MFYELRMNKYIFILITDKERYSMLSYNVMLIMFDLNSLLDLL